MADETDTRARLLGEFLAECDEPCPACGYNLRGLTGEACPECGEVLRLRVGMVEPRLGLFVAGLIGLAAGAGFNGVMTAFGAISMLLEPGYVTARDGVVLGLLGCAFALGVGAMIAWVRFRAWVRHCPAPGRVGLTMACWGFSAATVVVFIVIAAW
jgi:hypothetical protein